MIAIALFPILVHAQQESWEEVQKLLPVDASVIDDRYGKSLSLDDTKALIGIPEDDQRGNNSGGAYVFERINFSSSTGTRWYWSFETKLTGSDGSAGDYFGAAVATNNGYFAAGAPRKKNPKGEETGAAYIMWKEGTDWKEQKIVPPDGKAGDLFGHSIAVYGGTLMVGAPGKDLNDKTNAGAVYVYERVKAFGEWTLKTVLTPGAPENKGRFGYAIALRENGAVVGASDDPFPCIAGECQSKGGAFIFQYVPATQTWAQVRKLTGSGTRDNYGRAVAFNGEDILVGAGAQSSFWPWQKKRGAVYLYSFSQVLAANTASPLKFVIRPLKIWYGKSRNALFGSSLGIHTRWAAVGALGSEQVYLLHKSGGTWNEHLFFSYYYVAQKGTLFGESVAISDKTLLAGASAADDYGMVNTGAVRAIEQIPNADDEWIDYGKLPPYNSEARSLDFGRKIALNKNGGQLLASGITVDGAGNRVGAAYLFETRGYGGWWEQTAAFQSGQVNDGFGAALDISGRYILIGAPADHRCPAGQIPTNNHYGRTYLYYDQRNSDYNSWQKDRVFQGNIGDCMQESPQYGTAVALEDTFMIADAYSQSYGSVGLYAGAEYFYRNIAPQRPDDWRQIAIVYGNPCDLYFGSPLDIDRSLVVTGGTTRGCPEFRPKSFVFDLKSLQPFIPDTLYAVESSMWRFGMSVAVEGEMRVVVVGMDTEVPAVQQVVHVFRDNGKWELESLLNSPYANPRAFGYAVAVKNDKIFVGDPQLDLHMTGNYPAGSVFLYRRQTGTPGNWVKVWEKLAPAGRDIFFGQSLAFGNFDNTVALGSWGAVYIYAKSTQ